ncbi:MAG: glycosyltransferase [Verrucomicrobia bacterium]|nr:glycosyltransferase [Verrucomicrobiota bacterium]
MSAAKILIVTDSAALPSGMAETTRLIFEGLLDQFPHSYEIHQIGLFHCYAVTKPRWPIYATRAFTAPDGQVGFAQDDQYAQKTFGKVTARVRPDIVFAFGDPHRVLHLCVPAVKRRYRLILYLNFDGLPIPPNYGPILNNADQIFTKSEFSKNVILKCLPSVASGKLDFMYSPADIRRFVPVSDEAKQNLRKDLLPAWMPKDAFLLGWVGRNQWRKQNWVLYKVMHYLRSGQYLVCRQCGRVSLIDWDPGSRAHAPEAPLARESRPDYTYERCQHCSVREIDRAEPLDDVFLWLHMPEEPEGGWSPKWLEEQFGLSRERDIYYTPGYELKAALNPGDVPTLYQLWDCLLFLSGGEGFGLPVWEAMCSALPVIYTNYSSHAEFIGRAGAGLPVGGILQPETTQCVWRMIADVPQAIEAVRELYFKRELGRELGAKGRTFAERYRKEVQVDRWHQVFQKT